ncbi:MAG: HAMP domain-containing histidine kinase [Flavobacteriaceae bacterium]|nr:HAMP domain-containing histidine kinase [Flavobacteriaceae bacterium]
MKFLVKINRWYFSLLFITIVLVSIISYFTLRNLIIRDAKEKLTEKEFQIKEQLDSEALIPSFYPFVEVKKVENKQPEPGVFNIVYLNNKLENNEAEPYLEYTSFYAKEGVVYSIKLRQSVLENEDLLLTIILALISILILVFILIYLLNKLITKRIWQHFETNLAEIKDYSFDKPEILHTRETGIEEFDNLNKVLGQLTTRLRDDYLNTKEFAENASHEMQTPLSVMVMNLENILQEQLPETITKKVYVTYQSALKLQKLSKNLLLLTRIENNQYTNLKQVDISKVILEKIENFEPLINLHKIEIKTDLNSSFTVLMDPLIADVLVNNLLSNAINHNTENGTIHISCNRERLLLENTTDQEKLQVEELFKRFKKGKSSVGSNGLGLAIVQSIAKLAGLKITMEQDGKMVKVLLQK